MHNNKKEHSAVRYTSYSSFGSPLARCRHYQPFHGTVAYGALMTGASFHDQALEFAVCEPHTLGIIVAFATAWSYHRAPGPALSVHLEAETTPLASSGRLS